MLASDRGEQNRTLALRSKKQHPDIRRKAMAETMDSHSSLGNDLAGQASHADRIG